MRTLYRHRRRGLCAAAQRRHADAVASAIAPRLAPTDVVAAYYARDGEVNLAPLIERCWQRGIVVALPVLARRRMTFAVFRSDTALRRNRYGIPEPAPRGRADTSSDAVPPQPNIVLAPLVAFDDDGNRLGMGGGYYDRYFAAHPKVFRVGVAHECQCAQALPANAWDVPLAALVTEKGWRSVGASR